MKQPDLFSIYLKCKLCGASFHRTTKKKMYCSHKCAKKANDILRQQVYDEYKSKKVAAE